MNDSKMLELLLTLRDNHHNNYEDSWYSCPKSTDGCADKFAGTECNCGADERNARLELVLEALRARLAEPAHPIGLSIKVQSTIGYCPVCGSPGVQRERRLNGNDTCANKHTYPSKDAVKPCEFPSCVDARDFDFDCVRWIRGSCRGPNLDGQH